MLINITTSKENQEVVRKLTSKLPTGSKENVIARIALSYSLQQGKKFLQNEFNKYDSKGKEYKEHILFDSKYKDFYVALICQHYHIYKSNENIPRYIKLHIDHGLELLNNLFENNNNYTFFDFLIEHLDKGISFLENIEVSLDHVRNNNQNIDKSFFTGLLKLQVGKSISKNEQILINFNDTNIYNNSHIAVAGSTGTGKTQFALDILKQACEESNNQIKFIYLDFKGLKEDDFKNLKPFFDKTKAVFIDTPKTPFPLNPLRFIDNVNQINKQMGIDKFTDIVSKYSNLGPKQKGRLREATHQAFINKKAGEYPSFEEINDRLIEIVGDKKDILTEIIDELSRYNIFVEDPKKHTNFLNENIYLSLSGELSNSVRFTSLFLIINYLYNTFMNMDSTPVESGYRGIRYIILIDEAHVIFKERKYQDILEKILREIRSKGVSIILLSQGIEEYNQPSFDFSTMCEMAFLLDIKDKNNAKAINKFLGISEKEGIKVSRSLENIQRGQAVSNIKEFPKGELFVIKQFKDI